MPPGIGYDPGTIAAIIQQMRGQLGYGGAPAISRLTGPPARGRMAQGRPLTERDGQQGVMGRGGRFQVLGPSALGRLGRPGAGQGGDEGAAAVEGLAPIQPPVMPSLPMEASGDLDPAVGGLSGAASLDKPLFGLRGGGPVPPGTPPNPSMGRLPMPVPPPMGASPNVGGPPVGVSGLAGPPASPPRGMGGASGDKLSSMTGGGLMSGGMSGGTAVSPDIAARRMALNGRLRRLMPIAGTVAPSM